MGRLEFIDKILDRVEFKLKNDARMDPELRRNVTRQPPLADNQRYPILYYEEGEDDPKRSTTRAENHTIKLRLTVIIKDSNPLNGVEKSRKLCYGVAETLSGTNDDMRLLDANGAALAQDVLCQVRWGQRAKDSSNQLIWIGIVLVTITAQHNI